MLFTSGYHANIGAIAALVGAGDAVFSDELNHASIDRRLPTVARRGARSTRTATSPPWPSNCAAAAARRRLIVTDSIFSMDGDAAPLQAICDLAERHDAMVMVDEAHATGVLGPHGAGLVDELGLQARVTVQMGTLGKAFGTLRRLRRRQRAR